MVRSLEEVLTDSLDPRPESISQKISKGLAIVSDELGLTNLISSSTDVHILLSLKLLRLIGYNGIALIMILYLKELQFSDQMIGYFMTCTFIGDIITSFLFSMIADEYGRKKVFVICNLSMTLTATLFLFVRNPYVLTFIAFVGIITPGGGDVGPFKSLEQSTLATLVPYEKLSDIYAWYSFLAHFFAAVGSLVFGILVTVAEKKWKYDLLTCYKIAFSCYTAIAVLLTILSLCLSNKVEYNYHDLPTISDDQLIADESVSNDPANSTTTSVDVFKKLQNEETPLINSATSPSSSGSTQKKSKSSIFPKLSKRSLSIIIKLSLLFAMDSFGSSLISRSWQSYYIKHKFGITSSYLGSIFFVTGFISGFMVLISSSLCKRIGPIVTMVATHLPASILIAMIPIPTSLKVTISILIVRACTQAMDNPPKQVFLSAVVPANERTSVIGWVNVVKTISQMFGPSLAGMFLSWNKQWICFVLAGTMKSLYDLGILGAFLHMNKNNHRY